MSSGGGGSFGNLIGPIGSFVGAQNSASQLNFQAQASRNSITSVFGQASLDIAAVDNRLSIELGNISREIRTTTGQQKARAASTGLSVGSKSFLSIMANTSDVLLHEAKTTRKTAEIERQRIWYAAQVRATNLENQARLSEMRADAAQQQGMFSLLGGIGRLL